jgi:NAD(P)-dependent dehydrogenase (short-subunit alcohol dehydrogenase family)
MGTFPPDAWDDPLPGLRVAITGGTSGLGLAHVRELHGRGARVAFVARTPGRVEEVACEHPVAHGIVGVVSQKGDIHPIAVQTVGELGGLDAHANNASDLRPTPLRRSGTATPSQ